ncbi:MAG: TerB family tellurite resistance protein [Gammaproteobacteria bacterium]|nr:MAG: TerB family tellurite resistance protein [Gammaproteobacteria bacterium]
MVIAILTALTAFLWTLYRLHTSGFDLRVLNPFYLLRRLKWQDRANIKAIHLIEKPMEAAALLLVATAKLDGEITREQRNFIIQLFINEFSLTEIAANELYAASSRLLKDVNNIIPEVRLILAPCKAAFKPNQIETLLEMLSKVAAEENSPTVAQSELILEVRKQLAPTEDDKFNWK